MRPIFILFLFLGCHLLFAESTVLEKAVDAFDPSDPTKVIGRFEPGTKVDLLDYVDTAKMFKVRYTNASGQTIMALCRPEDLNRPPPPPVTTEATDSQQPAEPVPPEPTPEVAPQSNDKPIEVKAPNILNQLNYFDDSIWALDPDSFMKINQTLGFEWVKYEQSKIAKTIKDLEFLGNNVPESVVRFRKGKLQAVVLFLAKGAPGEPVFDQKGFDEFYAKVAPSLEQWSGFKGVDAWIKPMRGFAKRKSWFKYPLRVDLEWGSRQDPSEVKNRNIQVEFVRLHFTPYDGKTSILALTGEIFQKKDDRAISLKELTKNIQRDPNGDVHIRDIPMVEMSEEDYSVTSVADRLLRYYELTIDSEELQNAAVTGLNNDVNPEDMYRTIKKLSDRFGLSAKEIQQVDWNHMLEQAKRYNIVAKNNKLPTIGLPRKTTKLNEYFGNFNGFFLKQVRATDKGELVRFENQIQDHIEKGAPICWLVYLSWHEEKNPRGALKPRATSGPHMRMITGYNKTTREVIFSDPWGKGHEFKKMPLDDAYLITNGLYSILPSS